ncbi:TonB-dependent receptor family protein [Marinobacterium arenosum]|uniref:TonB-dependent receptor family protein n=1 Tax=Marinobacterium arenosum TaxID=2862496 RepID=UPI001C9461A7|nr:TonB-dependent siderophore receptor [Marinobacterium arenosum]MBY4676366.1 TonB-dependent siderophore receptor [Marinobacterium arenosum]
MTDTQPRTSSPTANPQLKRRLKRAFCRSALCAAVLAGISGPAWAQDAERLQQPLVLSIPAQSLARSITDLAQQAQLVVLLQPGQFQQQAAQPLQGQLTLAEALDLLLADSGYGYSIEAGNQLVLKPLGPVAQAEQMAKLEVVGNWLDKVGEQTLHEFPGARHRLSQQDFEQAGAFSLTEAFRKIPGMQVRVPAESYGANHALSVGVRGLKSRFSEKSTILLDGMPLSFAPYGQPQLSIAPISLGNLAAIDVVKGGSSVRYGPQNVGGIINFVTPDIPEQAEGRITVRGEGATGDAEGNLRGQVNAFYGGKVTEDSGLALLYSGSHGGNYREHSDEDIDDLMVKGETWLSDNQQLDGHLRYFKAKTEIPGGLNEQQFAEDPYQSRYNFNHFEGDRKEARLRYTNYLSDSQELQIQGFYATTYRLYGLQFNPDSRQRYDEWGREYDVYGIEPRYSQLVELDNSSHEFSVGYRYVKEDAKLNRTRWNNFAVGSDPVTVDGVLRTLDDAGTTAHALYLDDRIQFGDWTLTPGARLEKVEVFRHSLVKKNQPNDFRNEQDYTEFLPSVSLGYRLSPTTQLFANYNTSFGTLQHLQLSDSTENELEPEIARTVELGGRYRNGGLSADLTLFNINFTNKLQWDDSLGHHVNRGRTRHYGVEMGAAYDFAGGLNLHGNLAYTHAEFREGDLAGKELPYYSNWVGNLGAEYRYGDWTYNLEGYAQSKQYSDNENTDPLTVVNNTYFRGHMPGYMIWNLRASYRLAGLADDASIAFGLKNLFDQDYYTLTGPDQPYGAGIDVGAPRTAYVELSMGF